MTDKIHVAVILFSILASLLFPVEDLSAQIFDRKYLAAEIGFKRYKEVDKIISPLFYESNIVPVELSYRNTGIKRTNIFRLAFYSADLNGGTTGSRSLTHFTFSYTWLRSIVDFELMDKPMIASGGLKWNNQFNLNRQTVDIFFDRKKLNPSGYIASEINFAAELKIRADDKHFLYYTFSTPFIRYLVRPGYSHTPPVPDESESILKNLASGEWKLFSKYILFDQSLTYRYIGNGRFSYIASLSYTLNNIDFPRSYAFSNKGISIGVMYQL